MEDKMIVHILQKVRDENGYPTLNEIIGVYFEKSEGIKALSYYNLTQGDLFILRPFEVQPKFDVHAG